MPLPLPLPLFNQARGLDLALQSTPPFDFEGVTMRVFPLRARLNILQKFCDHFLNEVVPEEVARFRVFMPYVYLMVIDYGRMSVEAANLGWIAQREIAFSVPLQWYTVHDGVWTFVDWAFVSPFIYVDNELSMTTGREVYGWPKSMAWLDADPSPWLKDPTHGPRLASVSTMVFPEVYAGMKQEPRVFLNIDHAALPRFGQIPPDLESIFAPWMAFPRALRGSAGLLRDGYNVMTGLGLIQRRDGATPRNLAAMARTVARSFNPRVPNLAFNTINLKQFRSASKPDRAAYQAVTNASMRINHLNRGGLMGDLNLLAGDSAGGFRIKLHRYASLPIIETLGLVVADQWRGDGVEVAAIEPVCPFWLDVDMRYDQCKTLASRSLDGVWRDREGGSYGARTAGVPRVVSPGDTAPRFNTALGQATAAIAGPFDFPDTTLRVLPLLADAKRLAEFCKEYLDLPLATMGFTFEPWGSYVYLVASSYEATSSATNNVGFWAERDLVFYVPVRWYEKGQLRTVALLPVFSYANSTTAAITGSEVSGVPTLRAAIASPTDTWMGSAGPATSSNRPLVRMASLVFPVMGEGAGAVNRALLEVRGTDALPADAADWRFVAPAWGRTLRDECHRKINVSYEKHQAFTDARTLALEVLANRLPVNVLTLKQFRADDPSEACYQSLVQVRRVIKKVYDVREIEDRLHLFLHEHPSQPIVTTLGLVVKADDLSGGDRVFVLEPVRPFWMRVALHEELGRTVCHRADSETWRESPKDFGPADDLPYFKGQPTVGQGLDKVVDDTDPRRLAEKARTWAAEPANRRLAMTPDQAQKAVEEIDVQMVIETVLSREWENWGSPRWKRAQDEIAAEFAAFDVSSFGGSQIDQQVKAVVDHFDRIREQTRRKHLLETLKRELLPAFKRAATLLSKLALLDGLFHEAVPASPDQQQPRTMEIFEGARACFAEEEDRDALVKFFKDAKITLPEVSDSADFFKDLYDKVCAEPEKARKAVRDCTEAYQKARDALVYKLSKGSQKPDFCVRRDSVGPEAERDVWYPRDQCLDGEWYIGPPIKLPPPLTVAELSGGPVRRRHPVEPRPDPPPGPSVPPAR